MEISKNRSATARKSSEQPRQDTAKTALITPLRSLYSFIFPHHSSRHGVALSRYRSIRALCRPISLSLNTGSVSPYLARWAQYGLWLRLCAHCVARIRLRNRPISLSLNTGSVSPYFARWAQYGLLSSRGCATLTPGCILAPLQGAPFTLAKSTTPAPRASLPLAKFLTSAVGRCPFPIAKFLTSAVGRCPSPLAKFLTSAVGRCPSPLAIYGEGVADRPGVRSWARLLAARVWGWMDEKRLTQID